ncbi:hypothetical protein V6N13_066998 [Hibiscus sabdariffa]
MYMAVVILFLFFFRYLGIVARAPKLSSSPHSPFLPYPPYFSYPRSFPLLLVSQPSEPSPENNANANTTASESIETPSPSSPTLHDTVSKAD